MKNTRAYLIHLIILLSALSTYSQEPNYIDRPQGYRINQDGKDYIIFGDNNLTPDTTNYRKINYRVYFRKVDVPTKKIHGKDYQLITIPGPESKKEFVSTEQSCPKCGTSISADDYDQNFWIEVAIIEKNASPTYHKYANQPFSGVLTAPFKYRVKTGSAQEALIDGSFNVAPFFGWKFRLSTERPYYLALFGFTGFTSLSYNSSNNSNISDADITEVGSGITYGLGLAFRLGSVSPGVVLGYDHGLGNMGSRFTYTDKAWISFSISYDFFKVD